MREILIVEESNRIKIDGVVLRDRHKNIKRVRVLCILFLVMLILSIAASKIISFSGLIHIRKININCDIKGIDNRILDIAGLKEEMPLTPALLKSSEEKLEQSRYFRNISVYADMEGRVRIDVTVRRPVGIVIIDGRCYQVDSEGIILPEKPIIDCFYLPSVKYKSDALIKNEMRLSNFTVGAFLEKVPVSSMGKIEYVDISENRLHTFDGIDIITDRGVNALDVLRLGYVYTWLITIGVDRVDIRFDGRFIAHKREGGENNVGG